LSSKSIFSVTAFSAIWSGVKLANLVNRLIAKLSPAAGDAARRKFAALLRLNTRDV